MSNKPDLKLIGKKELKPNKELIESMVNRVKEFISELEGELKRLSSNNPAEILDSYCFLDSMLTGTDFSQRIRACSLVEGISYLDPRVVSVEQRDKAEQCKKFEIDRDNPIFGPRLKSLKRMLIDALNEHEDEP